MSAALETDVAIVGAGPTGIALAILLAQRGNRVALLERFRVPYPLPRAVHIDHEAARILQAAGVADALEGFTEAAPIYEWRNAAGEILLRFGRERALGVSGWPDSNMTHQPRLEAALEARARALPGVHLLRGCTVHCLEEGPEAVVLGARDEAGGGHRVRARFVVGCDGANSFVREAIGVPWHDLGFAFDWLVVDVLPHAPRPFEPLNWQLCDPARPTTLVSGGPGRRRWEFMRLPHETLEQLNERDTAWSLLAPWDVRPDNATLERHAVYTFRAGWAGSWRRGRCFVAGDAAHLMPPFAGQGLCSGLRDAASLAWKLDLVLSRRADDRLLDTYESERAPHARQTIDFSVALGRVICIADPAEAAARDARMVPAARAAGLTTPVPAPGLGPGCWLPGAPAAGGLFPQAPVSRGGRTGRFDDLTGGARFVLLSRQGDPAGALSPEQRRFLDGLGAFVAPLGPGTGLEDVTGAYDRWFAEQGCAVVLQRPDFAVFGGAPDLAGAGALVDALRASLAGESASISTGGAPTR